MASNRITPIILAGGSGTRLWPLSRQLYPKQLIPFIGDRSLLQETALRVADDARYAAPVVICNEEHRFMVAEQMRALGMVPQAIMLEPVGRNTAPAACVAALHLLAADPAATMLLLPSDHAIGLPARFQDAVGRALAAAGNGRLVTFGIEPDRPETGYGYIRRGAALAEAAGCHAVDRFVEKPDRPTAEGYLADGRYLWNSGMFLMPAARLLEEMERLQPEIVTGCRTALSKAEPDHDFLRLGRASFEAVPSLSIDYAVMEHTPHAAVVPAEMAWNDVGSWSAVGDVLPRDGDGNATVGDVVTRSARNCVLLGGDRLLTAIGVEDLIVVATDDAVMVCSRDAAQSVGELTKALAKVGRPEVEVHREVFRPWGSYRGVDSGERFQVKRLTVSPGSTLSLQRHRHRAEHWVVVEGEAEVTCDDRVFRLKPNESTFIPLGAVHRLANPGSEPLHVIEVQSGDYLDEDDIERFEDVYGRTEAKTSP